MRLKISHITQIVMVCHQKQGAQLYILCHKLLFIPQIKVNCVKNCRTQKILQKHIQIHHKLNKTKHTIFFFLFLKNTFYNFVESIAHQNKWDTLLAQEKNTKNTKNEKKKQRIPKNNAITLIFIFWTLSINIFRVTLRFFFTQKSKK